MKVKMTHPLMFESRAIESADGTGCVFALKDVASSDGCSAMTAIYCCRAKVGGQEGVCLEPIKVIAMRTRRKKCERNPEEGCCCDSGW